jgi:serine/threonine protein kinase
MSASNDPPAEGAERDAPTLAQLRQALGGRYEVGEEVGRGAMAVVYRAMDLRHNRTVALKVLHPALSAAVGADRFLREIAIEAQLNHPHVLALLDSGRSGDLLYYLTNWADGGTLRDRMTAQPQLGVAEALGIVREIGGALAHAHAKGIVHRDVKPENILFRSGHAMLADFGIARVVADSEASLTDSGVAPGTPLYMSPEQFGEAKSVDARSDQYALACLLYEMLVGEPPFTGRTARAVAARHMIERPPSIEVVRPDIPQQLAAAIYRALEKTPAARFPSVDDFVAALDAPPPRGPTDPHPDRSSRKRWWGGTAAAVGATALVIVFWPNETALSTDKVAVFPFATRALSPGDSGVGVGVAYLVEAALERANPLQLIDASRSLTGNQQSNPESITDRETSRIARELGAAFALHGIVQGHPDSTTVLLRLFSVTGDSLVRQASATGVGTEPLHHLGIDAIKLLLPALIDPSRDVDLTSLRDRSARSIALWMQGERLYRHSQFDSASRAYERALEDDSALALAAIKGAQAASWIHQRDRSITLVNKALALQQQLSPRYVLLARGIHAYLTGAVDTAVAIVKAAQALAPEWAEPSALLGEVYSHLLTNDGSPDSLARAAFATALSRDSGFTSPLYHLTEDAIRNGRLAEADVLIERFRQAGAEGRLIRQLTVMRDCVGQRGAMTWATSSPAVMVGVFEAAKSLSVGARQFRCADGAFRAVLRSQYATDGERWGAFLGLQGLLVARGGSREAKSMIDSMVASGRGAARTLYVLDYLAGAHMTEDGEALESYARRQFGDNYERLTNVEPLWVLLVWHAARGDTTHLAAAAAALDRRAQTDSSTRSRLFAEAGRAHLALARHDTTNAIAQLAALPNPGADLEWQFGDALPVERLLLARLLLAKGRYRESARAASVFDHPAPVIFLPFTGESLRIRYSAALAIEAASAADSARARLTALGRVDIIDAVSSARR